MPITHHRLDAIVSAALSILSAYQSTRRAIDYHAGEFFKGGDPGNCLSRLCYETRTMIPDLEGIALLGREAQHLKQSRHRNAKSRERMRAFRERRGESTPAPNHAFIPRYNPTGATRPQGPRTVSDETPMPRNASAGAKAARIDWAKESEFDLIPDTPPDFSGGLFAGSAGQGPDLQPSAESPAPDLTAQESAIWADPALTDAEKYAALERLYLDTPPAP